MVTTQDYKAQIGTVKSVFLTTSGIIWTVFSALVLGTVAIVVSVIPPRGNWMFRVAQLWGRRLLGSAGLRRKVFLKEPLDPNRAYVYMANHQSILDIPLLLGYLPTQTRFMAKSSLFKIPIFGWSLTAGGFIPVDRSSRKKKQDAFHLAIQRLKQGSSVLIFPEQTRSADGELLPFKRGGFLLAIKAGVSIVPVGVVGTGEAIRKGTVLIKQRDLELHFGSPVDTADYGTKGRAELIEEVRRRILELKGEGNSPSLEEDSP